MGGVKVHRVAGESRYMKEWSLSFRKSLESAGFRERGGAR